MVWHRGVFGKPFEAICDPFLETNDNNYLQGPKKYTDLKNENFKIAIMLW